VLRLGYRIYEVPIDYAARTRAQGKKLTWQDGVKAMFVLLRIRLSTDQSLFGQPDPYHADRQNQLTASLLGGFGDSQGTLTHEQLPGDKG
jgi:hypothetical protein